MKIILSRKGFDKTAGGGPSPIVDGKRLVSLPIKFDKERRRRFRHLRLDGENLGRLIEQLHSHVSRNDFCHLDPDVRRDALGEGARDKNWRPIFGQADEASTHLVKTHQIREGDLFLFFGLFQQTDGWKCFVRTAPKVHAIFGWFQVDEVILDPVKWSKKRGNRWAAQHPHTYGNWWRNDRNVVFLAKPKLQLPSGRSTTLPGAGLFEDFNKRLVLSDPESTLASRWRLPSALRPDPDKGKSISYLGGCNWTQCSDANFVGVDPGRTTRWQEAVITGNSEATKWAFDLITSLGSRN